MREINKYGLVFFIIGASFLPHAPDETSKIIVQAFLLVGLALFIIPNSKKEG